MAKLTKSEKKHYAEELFMRGDLTQAEIAKIVDVSDNTMSKWVNDEVTNWKLKRKSFLVTKPQIIRRILNVLDKLSEQADNEIESVDTKAADKFIKFAVALKKLEMDMGIAEIMEVAMLIVNFIQPHDPKFAGDLSGWFDKLIKERLKRY